MDNKIVVNNIAKYLIGNGNHISKDFKNIFERRMENYNMIASFDMTISESVSDNMREYFIVMINRFDTDETEYMETDDRFFDMMIRGYIGVQLQINPNKRIKDWFNEIAMNVPNVSVDEHDLMTCMESGQYTIIDLIKRYFDMFDLKYYGF